MERNCPCGLPLLGKNKSCDKCKRAKHAAVMRERSIYRPPEYLREWRTKQRKDGRCCDCTEPATGRRCEKHATEHAAREKAKYAVNPAHREKVIDRARAYHAANYVPKPPRPPGKGRDPAKRAKTLAAWKLANPDRMRELGVQSSQRRRARLAKAEGTFTREDWRKIVVGQESRCFDCGERCKLTIGHLHPLVRGGRHSPENIVGQCRVCNSKQGPRIHSILAG